MSSSAVRNYVVVLKTERVRPELRRQMRVQTRRAFGAAAADFAAESEAKVHRGDLPGVIAVGKSQSGALPMVFVTATERGAELLGRDKRVKAISAG